jgi:hypothetical protein
MNLVKIIIEYAKFNLNIYIELFYMRHAVRLQCARDIKNAPFGALPIILYYVLILFLFVGKVLGFDVVDVLADGAGDLVVELEVAAKEPGLELRVDTEEVVHD